MYLWYTNSSPNHTPEFKPQCANIAVNRVSPEIGQYLFNAVKVIK